MHVAASTGRVVAGRYLLQHPIGRGAMGTVWRAQDSLLARDVAVKEVRLRGAPPDAPGSPGGGPVTEETRVLYERTLREARTAARLNHPAVITVFDVIEEADGCPWIVMELIQGRSLEQIVAEDGPLPPQQAADLGGRLLSALRCAHAAGILHRDVKPSNVLLGAGGRAVLTDFGIATLEGDTGLTQAGMVMGTPGFTAPERVRGEPASPASDLWSLGATLFAAVEGHGPFDDRHTSLAILAAIANEDPPRPRLAGPLRPAIEALLRRDRWARPDAATAAWMLAAAQDDTGAAGPGQFDQGPFGQGPFDQGPFDQGPFDQGPFDQGQFAPAQFDPGQFDPGQFDPGWLGSPADPVPAAPGPGPGQPELHLLSPADEPGGTLASPAQAWGSAEPGQAGAQPGRARAGRGRPPGMAWPGRACPASCPLACVTGWTVPRAGCWPRWLACSSWRPGCWSGWLSRAAAPPARARPPARAAPRITLAAPWRTVRTPVPVPRPAPDSRCSCPLAGRPPSAARAATSSARTEPCLWWCIRCRPAWPGC